MNHGISSVKVALACGMFCATAATAQQIAEPLVAPAAKMQVVLLDPVAAEPVLAVPASSLPVKAVASVETPAKPATPAVMIDVPVVPSKPELAANSPVLVTPLAEISTKTLKAEARIEMKTAADVKNGNLVILPAGAKVFAKAVPVSKSGGFGRAGKLEVRFESLELADGTVVPLKGVHSETGQRGDTQNASNLAQTGAALAGSFGAVGALAGLLGRAASTGSAAKILPGAQLTAFTVDMVKLTPEGRIVVDKPADDGAVSLGDATPVVSAAPEVAGK